MLKKLTAFLLAGIIATSFVVEAGAIEFSSSNWNVEIVVGDHVAYQFVGDKANPEIPVDITEIDSVRYYIKVPEDLEEWGPTEVQLVYNSGTTGWVQETRDLHDGLIIDIKVKTALTEGDYFETAFGTWNENVSGTVTFAVLNAAGEVLGESEPPATSESESGASAEPPASIEDNASEPASPKSNEVEVPAPNQNSQNQAETSAADAPPITGVNELSAIGLATALALGIIMFSRKRK